MDLQLGNKTVLVTGSSKGIGEAIAISLAREGASVIVHGRDRAEADRVVHAIVANGGRAHAVIGDLTQYEAVPCPEDLPTMPAPSMPASCTGRNPESENRGHGNPPYDSAR
jgi:nucleoside-diphosphate-sugar epimerase